MRKIVIKLSLLFIFIFSIVSIISFNLSISKSRYKTKLTDEVIKKINNSSNNSYLDFLLHFENKNKIKKDEINKLLSNLKENQKAQNEIIEKIKNHKDLEKYESFYIVNTLRVRAKKSLMLDLIKSSDVVKVEDNSKLDLNKIKQSGNKNIRSGIKDPMWNIEMIKADKLWKENIYGEGITVGIIDTAVDINHKALKRKFKGYNELTQTVDYKGSFFDALEDGNQAPNNTMDMDHGTHVMGTILGSEKTSEGQEYNRVGVAPKAKFITARALDTKNPNLKSINSVFIKAGQWMLNPTGKPENRPKVINNSWGGGDNSLWYQGMLQTWLNADILPVFAAGNKRYDDPMPGRCNVVTPGSYPEALTVGAVDKNEALAPFSCAGPSRFAPDKIKPEVSAPGVAIRSAWPGNGYAYLNGTSMAAPHVTGLVALLASYDKTKTVSEIREIIIKTAKARTDSEFPNYPNMGYGNGIVDAKKSLLKLKNANIYNLIFNITVDNVVAGNYIIEIYKDDQLVEKTKETKQITLGEGSYKIKVLKKGYKKYEKDINVKGDMALDINLEKEEEIKFSGQVKSDDGNIENARIIFKSEIAEYEIYSSHNGIYNIVLPKGKYDIEVFKENYEVKKESLNIENNTENYTIFLNQFNKRTKTTIFDNSKLSPDVNNLLHVGNMSAIKYFGYEAGVVKFNLPATTKIESLDVFFANSTLSEFQDTKAKLSIFSYDEYKRPIEYLTDYLINFIPGRLNKINLQRFNLELKGEVYFMLKSTNIAKSGFVLGVDTTNYVVENSFVSEGGNLYKLDFVKTTTGNLKGNLMFRLNEIISENTLIDKPIVDNIINYGETQIIGKASGKVVAVFPNGTTTISKTKKNKFIINIPFGLNVGDEIYLYQIDDNGNRSKNTYLRILNNFEKLDSALEYSETVIASNPSLGGLLKKYNEIKSNYDNLHIKDIYPSYEIVSQRQNEIDNLAKELKDLAISIDKLREPLLNLIKKAEELLNNTVIADDPETVYKGTYLIDSVNYNIFKNNIKAAKNIVENLSNGQNQLNERFKILDNAIKTFKRDRIEGLKYNESDYVIESIKEIILNYKIELVKNNKLFNNLTYYEKESIEKAILDIKKTEEKDLNGLTIDELKKLNNELIESYYEFKKSGIVIDDPILFEIEDPFSLYSSFIKLINKVNLDNLKIMKIKELFANYYFMLLTNNNMGLINELNEKLKNI